MQWDNMNISLIIGNLYKDKKCQNVNNTAAIVVITALLLADLDHLHEPALEYASRASS